MINNQNYLTRKSIKKKIFVLLFFALFSKNGFAQYQPMVVDSALWIIEHQDLSLPVPDNYYGYYILGDTVVNSINYKKVYGITFLNTFPNWTQPFQFTGMGLFGFIREDMKQVYALTPFPLMMCPPNNEYLLYDFNYNIGDTIHLCLDANYPFPETIVNITLIGNIHTFHTSSGDYSEVMG